MVEEPDLQDSYVLDQREIDVIYELFNASPVSDGRRVKKLIIYQNSL